MFMMSRMAEEKPNCRYQMENAGLSLAAVRFQVIDVLEAQEIK